MKNIARGVILVNHIRYLQKLKKLPWKIIAENLVIQQGNENDMTVMKNLPLLEKKRRRRRRRNMKFKMIALKKKIAQMRSSVKLRMFKKLLLLHLQKDN